MSFTILEHEDLFPDIVILHHLRFSQYIAPQFIVLRAYMKSMYLDALTIQESIGGPLDKDTECHNTIGAPSVTTFLHQHEDTEFYHPTLKHIGLNHFNG